MKAQLQKGLWTIGLIVMLSAAAKESSAALSGWVRVYTDKSQNLVYYVDNASIRRNGSIRYFWSYFTRQDGQAIPDLKTSTNKPVYAMTYYLSTDCRQNAIMRLRGFQLFDQNNQLLDERSLGDRGPQVQLVREIAGGSALRSYVCRR